MDSDDRKPRRSFLGQLGLAALATTGTGRAMLAQPASSARQSSPWDMSWVDRVTAAKYRAVVDATTMKEGYALDIADDIMNTFHEVYGGPNEETRIVVVMRRSGTPMALQDALWDRYAIGEDSKVNDPATKKPARRNPYLRAVSGHANSATLEPLMARGLTVLVCNRSAMNWARSFAERFKRDAEEVQSEVRAGLVPGALLMPNGVFALVRAQNAGCAIMKET
jgi:intracellular sulfur oxidation DsrE/DsrF family protein